MIGREILLSSEGLKSQRFLLSWARFRILSYVPVIVFWGPLP